MALQSIYKCIDDPLFFSFWVVSGVQSVNVFDANANIKFKMESFEVDTEISWVIMSNMVYICKIYKKGGQLNTTYYFANLNRNTK